MMDGLGEYEVMLGMICKVIEGGKNKADEKKFLKNAISRPQTS